MNQLSRRSLRGWGRHVRRAVLGLALATSFAGSIWIYFQQARIDAQPGVLCLELTFGPERAAEVLDGWNGAERDVAVSAVEIDLWSIPIYVLVWFLVTRLALSAFDLRRHQRFWLSSAPIAAGVLNLLVNLGKQQMLDGPWQRWLPLATTSAAAIKFLLLAIAPGLALWAFWRRATSDDEKTRKHESPLVDFKEVRRQESARIDAARKAHKSNRGGPLVGLALSGGGIRSATFNLGLLQALARLGLLQHLDYLSSVSGGGYIASWLSNWIRKAGPGGVSQVVKELESDDSSAGREDPNVSFLRTYSNYLTPKVGILSADTWTTVATYLRNFLLNLVILVGTGFIVLLVPRMVVFALGWFDGACDACPAAWWPRLHLIVGFVLATIAVQYMGINLVVAERKSGAADGADKWGSLDSQEAIQMRIVIPLVLSSLFASYWLSRDPDLGKLGRQLPTLAEWTDSPDLVAWIVFTSAAYTGAWLAAAWFAERFRRRRQGGGADPGSDSGRWSPATLLQRVTAARFRFLVSTAPIVGFACGGALYLLANSMAGWTIWQVVSFGPPVIMALFTLTTVLHIGLMGQALSDALREWLARLGAWLLIYGLAWALLFSVATYAPVLIVHTKAWVTTALTGGWIASSLAGVLAGRAQQQGTQRAWHGALLQVAPWIFVVGLVTLLSFGLDSLLSRSEPRLFEDFVRGTSATPASTLRYDDGSSTLEIRRQETAMTFGLRERFAAHDVLLDAQVESGVFWLFALGLLPVVWAFSKRVDINEFSMHQYYRNRLVRCYLGASNPHRRASPFTDLDPKDDEQLGVDLEGGGSETLRPYHLVNTALNAAGGGRLSWQERQASSFVLAPLYSGFENPPEAGAEPDGSGEARTGSFRSTQKISGLSLGTAMAISGAAVSPNMGSGSSPALALLLTIFNVRLGWWLGNPRSERSWHRLGPDKALLPLLAELFGMTSEDSDYVYLSDGGHFENLGIYELVRRRCRFIITSDAAADPKIAFADLGNAIRKCRIDFGVDIEIDTSTLELQDDGTSRRHCALGKIRYPQGAEPEDRPRIGWLLYIKASLTGDEPSDVLQYATEESAFPHQSTADQFFSESQFESYRSLGQHIGERVFVAASDHVGRNFEHWEKLFQELGERWYAPSAVPAGVFSRHGATLDGIFARLSRDPNLEFLDTEIYPDWLEFERQSWDTSDLPDAERLRSGFYFCSSLIQLMENVYLDMQLDDEHDHPDNRGWINLFRQWSGSPMIQATWALTASTFGARFQTFCRRRLGLEHGDVGIDRVTNEESIDALKDQLVAERLRAGPPKSEDLITSLTSAFKEQLETELEARLATEDGESTTQHEWYQLKLSLPGDLKIPVGFCLLEGRESQGKTEALLIYFQIQRHLRRTGIARRGLGCLKSYTTLKLIDDDERLKKIPLRTWNAFKDLFESST